jgi:hypothetical protein
LILMGEVGEYKGEMKANIKKQIDLDKTPYI